MAFPGDEWAMVNLLGLVSAQSPEHALAQLERLQRLNPKTALLPAQIVIVLMTQGNFEMAAQNPDGQIPLETVRSRMTYLDVK